MGIERYSSDNELMRPPGRRTHSSSKGKTMSGTVSLITLRNTGDCVLAIFSETHIRFSLHLENFKSGYAKRLVRDCLATVAGHIKYIVPRRMVSQKAPPSTFLPVKKSVCRETAFLPEYQLWTSQIPVGCWPEAMCCPRLLVPYLNIVPALKKYVICRKRK